MIKFLLLILAVQISACSIEVDKKKKEDEDIKTHVSRKVIGRNDFKKVNADGSNIPSKYLDIIDAVGKISTKYLGGCTGVHVGDGIVVTAGHCLAAGRDEVRGAECPETVIKWGFRKNRPYYESSKCVEVLSKQHSKNIDFAIIKVDPVPQAKVEVNLDYKPSFELVITIFSHPEGRRLEWSELCEVKSAKNDEKLGESHFTHQCDTENASSGAPIFDDETLELIGIHNGSRYMLPWNYGSYVLDTPLADFL